MKSCRICLTTEEDEKFKPIDPKSVVAMKVEIIYSQKLQVRNSTAIICRQCEEDVDTSWKVLNRIQDANEYFEYFAKQRIAAKPTGTVKNKARKQIKMKSKAVTERVKLNGIVFECDACSKSFDSLLSLNQHIANHDGKHILM